MNKKSIKTAVILAAGLGSRFGERTKEQPKGFVKVGGEALIERSIRLLQEQGIEHIIIGTGHKNEHYKNIKSKYNLTIYENNEYSTTGSIYTLVLAIPFVSTDILLLESDILYQPKALELLLEDSHRNLILTSGFTQSNDEVYASADEDMNLTNLSKKPENFDDVIGELVGISKISHELLSDLETFVNSDLAHKKWDYEMGIVELAKKHNVKSLLNKELVWCEIDSEIHLVRAINEIYPRLMD
jgi:2-aminoethylphosphonate-pyruvate transaminase